MLVLILIAWFVVWFTAMSFIEHAIHRYIMHKRSVLDVWFPLIYDNHAIQHHRNYYRIFNYEPNIAGRHLNIRFELMPSLPIVVVVGFLLALISWPCSLMMAVVVFTHHSAWNLLHEEMHIPSGRFYSRWAIYRYLARYHWMHHTYPGKNFNVVVPLADFVWRTHIKPSDRDVAFMRAIGL